MNGPGRLQVPIDGFGDIISTHLIKVGLGPVDRRRLRLRGPWTEHFNFKLTEVQIAILRPARTVLRQ